jgi:hypothetical protein
MPWFPELISAFEAARREVRDAALDDPISQYIRALSNGDASAIDLVWPGEVVVHDPHDGDVRGRRKLRKFVENSGAWLREHHADTKVLSTTAANGRAVVELSVHLTIDGEELDWPVAIVAETPDNASVTFRTYHSRWPLTGRHEVRPPLLTPGEAHPGDVVGRYHAALHAGDTEAIVRSFTVDGYFREPSGPQYLHRGTDELRAMFTRFFSAGGGIGLQHCTVTDDGTRCALEYNCVRWGTSELVPQAGIGVYERGPDGLLAAARIYDDVQAPFEH